MEDIEKSGNNVEVAKPQTNEDEGWEKVDFDNIGNEEETQDTQQTEDVEENEPIEEKETEQPNQETQDRDLERDSAFANMRRKQEELEKELEKYKKADEQFASTFKDYGVNNVEDYLTIYQQEQLEQKELELEEKLANGDMTAVKEIIQKEIEPYKKIIEEQQQKEQQKQALKKLQEEIVELNSAYGVNVKTVDEIRKLPNGDKVVEYMQKSLTASDAYFLANKDTLKQDIVKKTKQQAINQVTGNSHIKANGSGAEIDEVQVPDEVIQGYREIFGNNIDLEEIKRDYKKQIQ